MEIEFVDVDQCREVGDTRCGETESVDVMQGRDVPDIKETPQIEGVNVDQGRHVRESAVVIIL